MKLYIITKGKLEMPQYAVDTDVPQTVSKKANKPWVPQYEVDKLGVPQRVQERKTNSGYLSMK